MKTKKLVILFMLLFAVSASAQTATEIPVSLKTTEGKYVGQVAGGGLDVIANAVTPKQTFTLVDLNGKDIADGDKIILRQDATQWREDSEKSMIHRVATKGAKENECTFVLRFKGDFIYFETPSKKFIRVEETALKTVSDAASATSFQVGAIIVANQPVSYSVAFKLANGGLIGMVAGGGLDATAKEIGTNQIFSMTDLNGGGLASGDPVKIITGQTQFREDLEANRVHRVPIRGAKEAECIFKIVVTGAKILLQTPSGKFVSVAADGKSFTTTDKKDDSSLFTAIPNPTPAAK